MLSHLQDLDVPSRVTINCYKVNQMVRPYCGYSSEGGIDYRKSTRFLVLDNADIDGTNTSVPGHINESDQKQFAFRGQRLQFSFDMEAWR